MNIYCVYGCRYLIVKGARLDAVNNDGELAIDLADSTDMENLLSVTMESQGAIISVLVSQASVADISYAALPLGGRITHCIPSVCLVHACNLKTECHRKSNLVHRFPITNVTGHAILSLNSVIMLHHAVPHDKNLPS